MIHTLTLEGWRRRLLLVAHLGLGCHVDAHDEAEQTDGRAEDLHNEDLDEQGGVGGVREGGSRSDDAHGDAAEQIDQTDGQAGAEDEVAGEPVSVLDGGL